MQYSYSAIDDSYFVVDNGRCLGCSFPVTMENMLCMKGLCVRFIHPEGGEVCVCVLTSTFRVICNMWSVTAERLRKSMHSYMATPDLQLKTPLFARTGTELCRRVRSSFHVQNSTLAERIQNNLYEILQQAEGGVMAYWRIYPLTTNEV